MRAPDLSWLSLGRWNALTPAQRNSFAPVSPEFIVEVRPRSDQLKSLQAKMQMWIANGVQVAWLVDPKRKVIEMYRPGDTPEIHDNPASVLGTGPVAGFELILSRIWD